MTTAFNVAMTTSQLLNAWVIAVFGQRIGFTATLIIFSIGSLICGFAEDYSFVVLGRTMQGFSAGVIQPLVMVTIFQVFPSDRRGAAMGLYGMALSLAVAIGPAFGGIAIEALNWRSIFFVPLPLVVVAFGAGLVFMPSNRDAKEQPFDWTGYGLIIVTLYCVMTGLTDGQRDGWVSNTIVSYFVVAAVAAVAFLRSQLRRGATLVDLNLFKNREYTSIIIITLIFGIGNFGTGYAVPVFGQLVQGMTPFAAGLVVMPAALAVAAALPFTGRLADTISPRLGIMAGLGLFATGSALMIDADVNTPYVNIMIYYMISRFGMAFTMPFLMSSALRSLPPEQLNAGAGMVNFCRQLGGSLGTNAWVVFVQMRTQFHSDALTATQDSSNAASRKLLEGVGQVLREAGVSETVTEPGALHFLGQVIEAQALTLGFQDGFLIFVIVFMLAMIPAWLLGPGKKK
jgi:EmrB/QacA subfamily drug resistance transporter